MSRPALLLLAVILALAGWASAAAAQERPHPPKFAGSYRIEPWRDLEAKGFFHFFYLHPDGVFLLGAEWPGKETSRAVGEWWLDGEILSLTGTVNVETNQGRWRVPFTRTFRVRVGEDGLGLQPVPQKNRFGLLGWPNGYRFFRTRPAPNLPSGDIPSGERNIAVMIAALREAWR